MTQPHEQLTLAEGLRHLEVPFRELWIGVAGLGGELSELEIEAYVLDVLAPDEHSHNLIAQALNEESLSAGNDHPVAYARGDAMTDTEKGTEAGPTLDEIASAAGLADVDPRVWTAVDQLGRALHVQNGTVQDTLDAILRSACQVVTSADSAGLNLLVRGRFQPQAVVGEVPHQLDLEQQASGVGPCIDASREQQVVTVADMGREGRWTAFAARAVELGVRSMLCVPLWVDELRLGSLSLYSGRADAFDEQAQSLAGLYATHAALALADAQRVANLHQALRNRDVIGQAKGILMATHRITAEQAFERLSHASQSLNVKLVKLAEAVSLTGELPTT